jgi:hypothetical protein
LFIILYIIDNYEVELLTGRRGGQSGIEKTYRNTEKAKTKHSAFLVFRSSKNYCKCCKPKHLPEPASYNDKVDFFLIYIILLFRSHISQICNNLAYKKQFLEEFMLKRDLQELIEKWLFNPCCFCRQ